MFNRTFALVNKTIDDIKTLSFVVNLIAQVVYIAYLIYAVIFTPKFLPMNIALLVISVAFLVVFLIFHRKVGVSQKVKRRVKWSFKIARKLIQVFVIGTSLVAMLSAESSAVTLQMLFTLASALTFVLNLIIDVISYLVTMRLDMFKVALSEDWQDFTGSGVGKVANFFVKRFTGKGKEKEPELIESK